MVNLFFTKLCSLLIFLIVAHNIIAQCNCVSPTIVPDPNCPGGFKQTCSGKFFTLNYCGPDTFYVSSSSCVVTLNIPTGSVNVTPPPNILSFNAALTGYSLGASIPAGEVVVVHYIAQGAMPAQTDTLCFRLVFVDTIPPVITASLADGTFACDVADYAAWANEHVDTLLATSTDNCAVDTVYYSPETGSCSSQVVTFFVVDESGNASTTTATFTTTGTVDPVLVGFPTDTILFLSCDVTVPAAPAVTATGNCAGALAVNFSETSSQTNNGSCNDNNYTILRTWSAEDACGNSVSTTQTIYIEDLTEPDFNVPADITIDCNTANDTSALGNISNLIDNCSSVFMVTFSELVVNETCEEKILLRSWTVQDECLNSRTKTQTITIENVGTCFDFLSVWNGTSHTWDLPLNWNDGKIPQLCSNVFIPTGFSLIPTGYNAIGKTLDVSLGARLEVPLGSTLTIE